MPLQGYEVINTTVSETIDNTGRVEAFVYAPSGKKPIGGGGFVFSADGFFAGSAPFSEEVNGQEQWVGWNAYGRTHSTSPVTVAVDVYMICVNG